jgi:hypothetical protein
VILVLVVLAVKSISIGSVEEMLLN